jgi:hypothetical protein
MKITEIKLNALINIGPYSHVTMDLTGTLDEGDDALVILESFKHKVSYIMAGIPVGENKEIVKEVVAEETLNPVADLLPPKAKAKAKKEKVTEVIVEAVIQELEAKVEKVKATKVTKYDSNVPEHKSIFGSYLAKAYGDAWKTVAPKEDIKNFTASLNGLDFIDNNGIMVDSFLVTVKGFFGA